MNIKELFHKPFLFLLLFVLAFGFLLGYHMGSSKKEVAAVQFSAEHKAEPTVEKKGTEVIVIQKGDTLWKIASTYFPKQPPEDVILYLRKLNHLEDDHIQVGAKLKLS